MSGEIFNAGKLSVTTKVDELHLNICDHTGHTVFEARLKAGTLGASQDEIQGRYRISQEKQQESELEVEINWKAETIANPFSQNSISLSQIPEYIETILALELKYTLSSNTVIRHMSTLTVSN